MTQYGGVSSFVANGDLPFFKFYPTDFASSGKVEAMTTEAVGAYILLLGKAWHQSPPCSLPDDPHILAKWSRLGVDEWAGVETMVLACWTKRGDGRLYNARLESEYIKATRERDAKAEGGKRSAEARRQVSSKILQRVLEDTSNIPEPKPDPELVNPKPRPEGFVSAASDSVGRSVGPDPQVGKMIRALGLNPTTEKKLLTLTDLTGAEINAVYASVKDTPGIASIAAVVATELLARRGIKLGRKGGPMASAVAGAIGGSLGNIEQIRRNRGLAS